MIEKMPSKEKTTPKPLMFPWLRRMLPSTVQAMLITTQPAQPVRARV